MFRPLVTLVVARTKEREFGFIRRFHAAYLRHRPVLMTAPTAFIGQLPLLYASSSGADTQRPLAVGVMGGFVTSSPLTPVVLPSLYIRVSPRMRPEGG